MSSYPNGYYSYESYSIPYTSNYDQAPVYGYSNAYLPTSSPNNGSVPMSYSTSGSSHGSRHSHNSHNSPYTLPSSPDEFPSPPTISPSASYSYPPIDVSYTAPVNTSTKGSHKQRTSSNSTSNTKPGTLCCLHAGCEYQTKRQYDLDRHQKTHFPSTEKFDCSGRGCGRTGEYGFDRKDHLREHLRKVHAKDIPKQGRRRTSTSPNHQRRG